MGKEHGAGVLNVVGSGVEQRVGGEGRTLGKVESLVAPGHTAVGSLRGYGGIEPAGIEAHADRRRCLKACEQGVHIVVVPSLAEVGFKSVHGCGV